MYEKLYEKIPDTQAYLARIQASRSVEINREYLDHLIQQHQLHVPFENLDIYLKRNAISIDVTDLFKKVVQKNRGGYCFELNSLFQSLLSALGFQAYCCMCRICKSPQELSPCLHQGILVTLEDQLYFCDVGFGGPMPGGSLLVADGSEECIGNEWYYVEKRDEVWWRVLRKDSEGNVIPVLEFYTMYQEPVNFIPQNFYCSHNPESVFAKVPFVNMRTKDGSVGIFDQIFTETKQKKVIQKITIKDENQLFELLNQYFHIQL